MHASYTGQRVSLKPDPGSRDTTNARAEADDPSHIFSMRSYVDLPRNLQLDGFFRAVGKLRASNLPRYQELDVRIGWQATERIELSLMGRELLHARHAEFAGGSTAEVFSARVRAESDIRNEMIRHQVRGFVAGVVILCASAESNRAQSALEYDVKAALLLNFARFIEWPEAAFENARSPIDVCVLAPSPFGDALERTLAGETVANRPVSARQVRGVTDSGGCHLLFIPFGAESRASALLRQRSHHTITVGESPRFADMGGAVNFVIEGGRVRFNVNLSPVEDRGVRISARMLQLAGRVDRATPLK